MIILILNLDNYLFLVEGTALRISNFTEEVIFQNFTLKENINLWDEGTLYIRYSNNISILNSYIIDNIAKDDSGGGILMRYSNNFTIENTLMTNNTCLYFGCGIN